MMQRGAKAICHIFQRADATALRLLCLAIVVWGCTASQTAQAETFDIFGVDGKFLLTGTYAYAIRLEEADPDIIDAPGQPDLPVPEDLKYPESNNFDDGDRNFDQYDAVNNRFTMLGELEIKFTDNFGLKFTGDAFYDFAYHGRNANEAPNRLNTRQEPPDSFTEQAERINGGEARLLDAYAYGSFYLGDTMAIDIKVGKHIAAWGESLFFSGVAIAQSPADATKATVPGADVKSILLPTNQLSTRITLTDDITLLGQWKFAYEPNRLNPTGGFFTRTDIVGPGAEFIYGLKNPLFLDNLSEFDLTDPGDLTQIADLLDQALLGSETQEGPLQSLADGLLNGPLNDAVAGLPTVSLPAVGNLLNAPRGLNPERAEDIHADDRDTGQWGLGLEYDLNFTTTLGFYHLNYHNTNPAPRQNFGYITLIPEQGVIPEITTRLVDIQVPVTYNIKYFEDVQLDALSFSTVLFGANIGGELIYRDGIDVMVDVPSGLLGPIPTPARAESYQALLNGITSFGPGWFWDSLNLVGEIGYIRVDDVESQPSQEGPHEGEMFKQLTYDDEAAAFAALAIINKRNVFPGWNLSIPVSVQGQVYNRAAVAGTFGSLLGEDDYRFGISFNFTRLQTLTLGITYNGFIGDGDFESRPLQDRDTLAATVKYDFF